MLVGLLSDLLIVARCLVDLERTQPKSDERHCGRPCYQQSNYSLF